MTTPPVQHPPKWVLDIAMEAVYCIDHGIELSAATIYNHIPPGVRHSASAILHYHQMQKNAGPITPVMPLGESPLADTTQLPVINNAVAVDLDVNGAPLHPGQKVL